MMNVQNSKRIRQFPENVLYGNGWIDEIKDSKKIRKEIRKK